MDFCYRASPFARDFDEFRIRNDDVRRADGSHEVPWRFYKKVQLVVMHWQEWHEVHPWCCTMLVPVGCGACFEASNQLRSYPKCLDAPVSENCVLSLNERHHFILRLFYPQILIKRLAIGLTPQEIYQRLHLILTATLL